jgi:hypothetical protein
MAGAALIRPFLVAGWLGLHGKSEDGILMRPADFCDF